MAQTVDGRRISSKGADGTIRSTDDEFPISRYPHTRHLEGSDSIAQRGIRRWIRQLFALEGVVIIKKGGVVCLTLNANYPLMDRLLLAFRTLLEPYGVCVQLTKT